MGRVPWSRTQAKRKRYPETRGKSIESFKIQWCANNEFASWTGAKTQLHPVGSVTEG